MHSQTRNDAHRFVRWQKLFHFWTPPLQGLAFLALSFFIYCVSSTMPTIPWLKMIIWVTGVLTRTVARDWSWRSVLPHWLSKRQSPKTVLHRSLCYSWVQIIFWLMSTMFWRQIFQQDPPQMPVEGRKSGPPLHEFSVPNLFNWK